MKIGENNKLSAALLALSVLFVLSVMVLIHGCAAESYPTEDTSTVVPSGDTSEELTTMPTGVLQSIAITRPLADSLDTALLNGKTDYFVATGTFADGSTHGITQLVTWTSSDPLTAAVKIYKPGLGMGIMALKVGAATITATSGGVSKSILLTTVENTGY